MTNETMTVENNEEMGQYFTEDGEELYNHWVAEHGGEHLKKWFEKHGDDVDVHKSKEFTKYMADGFMEWIVKHL